MRALAVTLAVLILAGGLELVPSSRAGRRTEPPKMLLKSRGKTVAAVQGSYCWLPSTSGMPDAPAPGLCADATYPLPVKCRLPVRRRAKLIVDTGTPALSVNVRLIKHLSRLSESKWRRTKRNRAGQERWRIRLPRFVARAAAIDVFAVYESGDSDTWTGLATRACRSTR